MIRIGFHGINSGVDFTAPYRSRTSTDPARGDLGHLFSEWKGIPSDLLRASGHTSGLSLWDPRGVGQANHTSGCVRCPPIFTQPPTSGPTPAALPLSFWRGVGGGSPPPSSVHSSGIVSERRRNGGNPSRSPTTFYLRPRREKEVHKSKTQTSMLTFSHTKQSVKRIPHN